MNIAETLRGSRGAASGEARARHAPRGMAVQLMVAALVVLGVFLLVRALTGSTTQSGTAQNGAAHSSVAATQAMNGMAGMSAGAPVYTATVVGAARVDVTVTPAKVGANTIALAMVDNRTVPHRFTAAKQLSVTATLPQKQIGPLSLHVQPTEPGRYQATGAVLNAPGLWTLEITYRTPDGRQAKGTVRVPIS